MKCRRKEFRLSTGVTRNGSRVRVRYIVWVMNDKKFPFQIELIPSLDGVFAWGGIEPMSYRSGFNRQLPELRIKDKVLILSNDFEVTAQYRLFVHPVKNGQPITTERIHLNIMLNQ